jgi:hypothetical protein
MRLVDDKYSNAPQQLPQQFVSVHLRRRDLKLGQHLELTAASSASYPVWCVVACRSLHLHGPFTEGYCTLRWL